MKEKTANDVILTPIYKGEVYKYHECSNCKKEIYFEENIFQPFHFEEELHKAKEKNKLLQAEIKKLKSM